ncbi:MAG TPA: LamG domain-containing protein, partial [Verrucomicrobiae bacterium]
LSLNGVGANASNNMVLIPSKVLATDASGSWSVGFWLKTTTAGGVIFYQGDGTWSSSGQTMFYLNNNSTTAGTRAGAVRWAGGWLTGTAALNNNAWHFVTLVDNAGSESIYVDGNVDTVVSTMGKPLASGANQIWIGASPDGGDGAAKLNGLIDEVFMFNRALTQNEIQNLYSANTLMTNNGNVLPPGTAVTVAAGAQLDLGGVTQTISSLTGGGLVTNTGAAATLTLSNNNGTYIFNGNLGDAGVGSILSVTQNGGATNIFNGYSTQHGAVVINGGALQLNGALGTGLVTVTAGALGGSGTLGGSLLAQSGAAFIPGGGFTTMTVASNVTLQLGSTTYFAISKATQTNDQLAVGGTLSLAGGLVVTNMSGTLAAGDAFQILRAGTITGAFTTNTLPALDPGFGWSLANLNNGWINVVATVPTNLAYTVASTNLNLSWPAGYVGWRLQVQTNAPGMGLGTNWQEVPGGSLTNQLNLPVDPTQGNVFYRLLYP